MNILKILQLGLVFQIKGVNKPLLIADNNVAIIDAEGNGNINLEYKIEQSGQNLSNGEKQIMNFIRMLI